MVSTNLFTLEIARDRLQLPRSKATQMTKDNDRGGYSQWLSKLIAYAVICNEGNLHKIAYRSTGSM